MDQNTRAYSDGTSINKKKNRISFIGLLFFVIIILSGIS